MPSFNVPAHIKPIARIFAGAGFQAFLVGGAVRDMAMGMVPTDFDISTDATPQQVISLFNRVIPTGIDHGTVTVLFKGAQYEVTTFRTETTYSDGRRPDSVAFSASILDDLSRRDLTINGMALNANTAELIDPYKGQEDIRNRIVRATGDPQQRFEEDSLRLLRAIRFAVRLSFQIEPETLRAIETAADGIVRVSVERIRDELIRMIQSPDPRRAFRLLRQTGLLEHILPELLEGIGVSQQSEIAPDVFEHLLLATEGAPVERLDIRLAALLHDIAKPRCRVSREDVDVFYGHDEKSAEMARDILLRLKLPNRRIDTVFRLIRHHMFHYTSEWSDSAVRRFVSRVGAGHIDDLLLLRAADIYGKTGRLLRDPVTEELRERITELLHRKDATTIADLAVNGNDLIAAGIPSGRAIGTILTFLLETVMDDPSQNNREQLLTIARRFYRERLQQE